MSNMRPVNALLSAFALQQAYAFTPSLFGARVCSGPNFLVRPTVNQNQQKTDVILWSGIGYLSDYYDFYEKGKDKNRDDDDGDIEEEDIEEEELDEETLARMEEEGEEEEIKLDEIIIEKPVPASPNSKEKFVFFALDSELDQTGRDSEQLFEFRRTFQNMRNHVQWAREANLVNETVHEWKENVHCEIPWSMPLLSSDLQSEVGQVICIHAQSLDDCLSYLSDEPHITALLGDMDKKKRVSFLKKSKHMLFRWRHIKEAKLRQADGLNGFPTMAIGIDAPRSKKLRNDLRKEHYEYLIRSERVIMAGPLHNLANDDDAIGNLFMFNAESRMDAVSFAEDDPCALAGLYGSLRVHRYNNADVSGKYIAVDKYSTVADPLWEQMESEGYAVYDYQTPWLR